MWCSIQRVTGTPSVSRARMPLGPDSSRVFQVIRFPFPPPYLIFSVNSVPTDRSPPRGCRFSFSPSHPRSLKSSPTWPPPLLRSLFLSFSILCNLDSRADQTPACFFDSSSATFRDHSPCRRNEPLFLLVMCICSGIALVARKRWRSPPLRGCALLSTAECRAALSTEDRPAGSLLFLPIAIHANQGRPSPLPYRPERLPSLRITDPLCTLRSADC